MGGQSQEVALLRNLGSGAGDPRTPGKEPPPQFISRRACALVLQRVMPTQHREE